MNDLHRFGNWYYYLRRFVRRCHHRHPTLLENEWGTAPGSGMVDVYCGRHRYAKWAGAVPLDDVPWGRHISEMMMDEGHT